MKSSEFLECTLPVLLKVKANDTNNYHCLQLRVQANELVGNLI
jgi:hypothetical protein